MGQKPKGARGQHDEQPRSQDPHQLRGRRRPTQHRAFAKWCFTVECDRPSLWAALYEPDPSGPWARAGATGSAPYHVPLPRRGARRVNEARSALPVVR